MTGEQSDWIRAHKPFQPVSSRAPGGFAFTKRGILHADGKFTETPAGGRPVITPDCIEVGILTKMQDLERR